MTSIVRSLRKKFGGEWNTMAKCDDFIQDLFVLTSDYDGDGNGLCGDSDEEVVGILEKEYPALFEAYKMLKEVEENALC